MSDETDELWVGFDLGGTKMLAVVYDADFKPLGKSRKKTKGHEGKNAGLKRINSVIEEALEDAGVKAGQVKGLGIGCPGPLDLKKKMIRIAPNLGWENVEVGESIENSAFRLPLPTMSMLEYLANTCSAQGKENAALRVSFPGLESVAVASTKVN